MSTMYMLIILKRDTGVVSYYETSTDLEALKFKFDIASAVGTPVSVVNMKTREAVHVANSIESGEEARKRP